jgi:hypothetical protein
MPVARRIGLKIDVFGAASKDAIFTGHGPSLLLFGTFDVMTCTIVHILGQV